MGRLDAARLSRLARVIACADVDAAEQVASSLLGCAVAVEPPNARPAPRPSSNALAVDIRGEFQVTLEVPGALAAWVVDRALGDSSALERMDGGLSPRDEMSMGIVAYVIARVVQSLPGRLQVSDVQPMHSAWPSGDERATCIDIPLRMDNKPVLLRAWMRGHHLAADIANLPPPRNPLLLRALLQERSVLSAQLMAPLEVPGDSDVRLDDVRVLRGSGVRFTPQGIVGNVVLRVLGARQQVWHGALNSDRIELQERVTMKDDDITEAKRETTLATTQTTTDLTPVADAPLELSVEIARFTLPLGEIASLCRGEVLLTGRPVGQHVTLRAGSRAIAIGELVDVDGAIGVRVVDVVR